MILTAGRAKAIPAELLIPQDLVVRAAGATISATRLAMVVVSAVTMVLLDVVVFKTKFGRAMRATSQDSEAAEYMGVNTAQVIAPHICLGVSPGWACRSDDRTLLYPGRLHDRLFSRHEGLYGSGTGGIGSFRGAAAGGLLLGLAESFGVLIAPPRSTKTL